MFSVCGTTSRFCSPATFKLIAITNTCLKALRRQNPACRTWSQKVKLKSDDVFSVKLIEQNGGHEHELHQTLHDLPFIQHVPLCEVVIVLYLIHVFVCRNVLSSESTTGHFSSARQMRKPSGKLRQHLALEWWQFNAVDSKKNRACFFALY